MAWRQLHAQVMGDVDDERATLHLISQILTRAGYTVHLAGNASESLNSWRDHMAAIDVLLRTFSDGWTGLQLAARLESKKPLKVIVSSGYLLEPRGDKLYLQKPDTARTLLECVGKVLAPARVN